MTVANVVPLPCRPLLVLLLLPALLLCADHGSAQAAGSVYRQKPVQTLIGEFLDFDIAFLWFDRLAEGRLTLSPGERPDTYQAVLEARTLGIAAWLSGEREHHYVTQMEMGEGKFRALHHEARIVRWRGSSSLQRVKRYTFDHAARQVHFQRFKDGAVMHDAVLPMDQHGPGIDILTVSYNFRAGVYGPLHPGAHFRIPTFHHKGTGYITIDILTDQQRQQQPFFPRTGGVLLKVQVDPEIFDTGNGILHVWLDEQGRPARSMVEKVAGIGTVRGIMR
jgi:hypothetical protein